MILYEALTGKLPFKAKTPMEYIQKHVTEKPIPINERVDGLAFPAELWTAISKAIAKNPDHRFQTAADFAQALRPITSPGSGHNHPLPSSPVAAPSGGPTPAEPASPKSAPSTGLLIGVAALFLVVGVVIAVVAMSVMR